MIYPLSMRVPRLRGERERSDEEQIARRLEEVRIILRLVTSPLIALL